MSSLTTIKDKIDSSKDTTKGLEPKEKTINNDILRTTTTGALASGWARAPKQLRQIQG